MSKRKNFYDIVELLKKDKRVAEHKNGCLTAVSMELKEKNEDLTSQLLASKYREENKTNALREKNQAIESLTNDLEIRTGQLNEKIDETLEYRKLSTEKDRIISCQADKIQALKAQVATLKANQALQIKSNQSNQPRTIELRTILNNRQQQGLSDDYTDLAKVNGI